MTIRMSDAESWSAQWMRLSKLCKRMAEDWPEYVRLAAMPSTDLDGYGTGGGGGGRAKGTHADPVLALTERKEGAPDEQTPVAPDEWLSPETDINHQRVVRLYAEAVTIDAAMRRLEGLKRVIDNRGDARYGRQSSVTDCLCCEATVTGVGEDRIKAGYCPTCHRAWCRWRDMEIEAGRDPNHEQFRRARRVVLSMGDERAS